ncbi:MAG: hypothetical protein NT069_35760, partial [Planctomycetota bacterium]|nr:hypothetical protein [Planctomycetota bacterium]
GSGFVALPQRVLGLTAIRLPGINPQRFLDACYPHVRFLFQPAVLIALGLFVVGVFSLLATEFDSIRLRLPALASFLTPDRLIWLWGAVAAARVVHELAHAFCCRHFGGRCPELGVMLL